MRAPQQGLDVGPDFGKGRTRFLRDAFQFGQPPFLIVRAPAQFGHRLFMPVEVAVQRLFVPLDLRFQMRHALFQPRRHDHAGGRGGTYAHQHRNNQRQNESLHKS